MTHRRTKIVCTIGPASDTVERIQELIEAGMNVARLNFSHGSHESHAKTVQRLRSTASQLGREIAILQDLSGPKLRLGTFAEGAAELSPGGSFVLTIRSVLGDANEVSINYPDLVTSVKQGDHIVLADGEQELQVHSTTDTDILCEVLVGGIVKSNKGINAPGVTLRESVPTQKDIRDLRLGTKLGVDWIAQSFVRNADELRELRRRIHEAGGNTPIMAKLEKREALDDLDAILEEADGVMIARGDLGLEVPIQRVPILQKEIIRKADLLGKPEVTATQMLESMINNPRPTRAEVTDIANAIFDGTDAVMLSGETAVGSYPVQAAEMMAKVAEATEEAVDYVKQFQLQPMLNENIPAAIAHAACHMALALDAKLILCCTRSGQTARLVSRYRPHAPIGVVSPHQETLRQVMLLWGTYPIRVDIAEDTDAMIANAKQAAVQSGLAQTGDVVVIVAGVPVDVPGTTNMLKADVL